MLVIAMLQGLLLWWTSYTADLGIWPGTDPTVSSALFGFAFFMAPVLYALSPWWRGVSAWLLALVIGLLLALSSWHAGAHESAPGGFNVLPMHDLLSGLFVVQLVLLFHTIPFLQSYLQNGHWRAAYADLFRFSWDNAVHLALVMLFTGIAWLLLWLCSELFDMLGLPFLRVVLQEIPGYPWLILSLAFGIGFFLVGSSERLLVALRQQVLTLLKWLTPVAATVLVAFSVALIIRTPWLLSEHRHVISAKWLLSLVLVAVYLYNAAYQDGQVQTPYWRRLGQMLSKVTPLLALLSIMAAYDLWVRIDAYGLTSTRYWAVVVSIIAVAYAVGYSVAGFRGSRWMSGMGPTNVCVAIAIIALLTFSMTPALYPGRLAARSQAHRLAQSDGTAGPRDFMSLRFDAGGYGYDELASLVEDSKVPPAIRKGAQAAIAVKDWRDERSFTYTTIPAVNVLLEAFPAGALIDADLRLKIASLVSGGAAFLEVLFPATLIWKSRSWATPGRPSTSPSWELQSFPILSYLLIWMAMARLKRSCSCNRQRWSTNGKPPVGLKREPCIGDKPNTK